VLLPAEIVSLPIKAARARARDLLNLVGLAGYEDKYPQQLSGGMQQRTAIARAFIHDPKLILMDEPFGALDALTREQMNLEMLKVWRESGKTIIFVTHSIQEAVFLGSHCAVLTAGPARMAEYFPIELPFPRAADQDHRRVRRLCTADLCELGAWGRRVKPSLRGALATKHSNSCLRPLDCFAASGGAEPVIGRAFARPVGADQLARNDGVLLLVLSANFR
jgi:NitT/TauT family transport system ATP-binding protein